MAQAGTVYVDVRANTDAFVAKMRTTTKASAEEAERAFRASGVSAGDGFVRGADGKLRDGRSRFLSAGQGAGESFAAGLTSSLRSGLSSTVGLATAGLAAGAIKTSADFGKAVSGVGAVSGASAAQLKQLSAAALEAGQATTFSASEAATAEAELAKAGLTVADILGGGLTGALDLAAAGQLQLADAAMVVGQSLNTFKLQANQTGRVADVLAAGANKSAADVSTLAQALAQGGLVASQTGLSLEDTIGTLSLFADRALVGSDAGTSLKTMLSRLTPQSDEAAKAMTDLGLSFFDTQGRFVGIEETAQRLQDALKGLSTEQRQAALNTLFGADAIRAASLLYDAGAKGVRDYVQAVSDVGAAGRTASLLTDNLAGDFEQLGGAAEATLIKLGQGSDGPLRDLVQGLTGLTTAVGNLPTPAISALGIALTGIGGAALAGGALSAVGSGLSSLGTIAGSAASSVGALSGGLNGLTTVGAALQAGLIGPVGLATAGVLGLVSALLILDDTSGEIDARIGEIDVDKLQSAFDPKNPEKFKAVATDIVDSLRRIKAEDVGPSMAALADRFQALARTDPEGAMRLLKAVEDTFQAAQADDYESFASVAVADFIRVEDAIEDTQAATRAGTEANRDLARSLGVVGDQGAAAAAGIGSYGEEARSALDGVLGFAQAVTSLDAANDRVADARKNLAAIVSGQTDGLISARKGLKDAQEGLTKALEADADRLVAAQDRLTESQDRLDDALAKGAAQATGGKDFIGYGAADLSIARDIERAQRDVAKAERDLAEARRPSDGVESARARVLEAQARYNEELANTGPASEAAAEAQRELDDAQLGVAKAAGDVSEAMGQVTTEDIPAAIAALQQLGAQHILTKQQVDDAIASLLREAAVLNSLQGGTSAPQTGPRPNPYANSTNPGLRSIGAASPGFANAERENRASGPAKATAAAPAANTEQATFLNSFPKNPTVGQFAVVGGVRFQWTGSTWMRTTRRPGEAAPANPVAPGGYPSAPATGTTTTTVASFLNSFPKSPKVGQGADVGGRHFNWDGTTWVPIPQSPAKFDTITWGGQAWMWSQDPGHEREWNNARGEYRRFARGGLVPGIGIGDSVRSLLTPREYVSTRATVQREGPAAFDALNRGDATITTKGNDELIAELRALRTFLAAAVNQRPNVQAEVTVHEATPERTYLEVNRALADATYGVR